MGKYETWLKKWAAEQEAALKKGLPRGRLRLDAFVEKIIREHGSTPLRQESPEDPLARARLAVAGGRRRKPTRKRSRTNPEDLEAAILLAMRQRRKHGEDAFGRRGG